MDICNVSLAVNFVKFDRRTGHSVVRQFVVLVLLFVAAFSVGAAALVREGDELIITGEIDEDLIREIHVNKSLLGVRRVAISSQGGELLPAIALARWIRESSIDVRIFGLCASACANYIFPAGKRKILTVNSLLIWHGGAFQKNFVDFVLEFEERAERVGVGLGFEGDKSFISANQDRYVLMKLQQAQEMKFYEAISVNPLLPIIGKNGGLGGVWTLSDAGMRRMGIEGVELPDGYGSREYVNAWIKRGYGEGSVGVRIEVVD